MSSTYGKNVKISIFGQSHSAAIGVVIDGLPAGFSVDMEKLQSFLSRRAPGRSPYATPRKEADQPEFLSGLIDHVTCGAPVCAVIRNTNTRSQDYDNLRDVPRPGHADYTAHIKYRGYEDVSGGGHFSGRLTAPLCVAGGIILQILEKQGITVQAEIQEIGGSIEDPYGQIEKVRSQGDSVGGIIECTIEGMPAGIGSPMFDGIENKVAQAVFSIPAVKGIEFGRGFETARMTGSKNNDEFYYDGDQVRTKTNNHGGVLGGISSGMPVVFRVAIKPTPSISIEQNSISYSEKKDAKLAVRGRHDPCIVPRAVPCVEAAAAIAIYDLIRGEE
ncbi:chorismate synthase [Ihubacter sp. mB4P-1]|uniref:chorismate synthase n=1 Tax=Ihubacter sp. mB4P-1 TaxID=3242370 RepID=UPI003C7D7847